MMPSGAAQCLTESALALLLCGEATPEEAGVALAHFDTCATCRSLAATLGKRATDRAGALSGEHATAEAGAGSVGPGALVGRYVLLHALGAGAMGVVFAAYDPELDRKVAIKLVRTRGENASRLLFEAQAMAKVSHPNVVTAHDAGRFADRIYVVMKLAPGVTLRSWLAAAPRPPGDVLRVMRAIGAGLSAAHRAGIVHRDVKPENIVVDLDAHAHAHVTDFGLASAEQEEDAPGTLVGTLAYMSPEQLRGERADARSDVFSFGVTLCEALTGARPFSGDGRDGLLADITTHGPRVPRRAGVSDQERRAIERCLRARPEDRWPTMDALLAALSPPARTAMRTWALVGAALVVVAGSVAASRRSSADDASVCKGAERKLAGVWDDARRAEVAVAFAGGEKRAPPLPYAAAVLASTEASLDAYAGAWVAAHDEACKATRVHAEQSEAVLDARMACLDARRRDLQALVAGLTHPSAAGVGRAVAAVGALLPVDACLDARQTPARPRPTDPAAEARKDALRATLATLRARVSLGEAREATAALVKAADDARHEGDPRLVAEVLLEAGRAHELAGDDLAARASLEEASWRAERAGDDALLARVYLALALVVGTTMAKGEEGSAFVRHAEAVVERMGSPAELQAETMLRKSGIERRSARWADAIVSAQNALELYARLGVDGSLEAASAWLAIAISATSMGKHDDAFAAVTRALSIREKLLGQDHPDVARAVMNLATIEDMRGNRAPAEAALLRSLAIFERTGVLVDVAMAEENLGVFYGRRDDRAHARPHFERASKLQLELHGDHPSTVLSLCNSGDLELADGNAKAALARYEAAAAMLDRLPSQNEQLRAASLTGLGRAALLAGDAPRAEKPLEAAVAIYASGSFAPEERAEGEFALAQALRARGKDPARARRLAEEARAHLAGEVNRARRADVEAWLAKR